MQSLTWAAKACDGCGRLFYPACLRGGRCGECRPSG